MPLRLSDGNITLWAATQKPAKMDAPTVAEIKAAKRIDCFINKQDYKLGATGSSTINETALCKRGEGKAFGPSAYEGSVTPFWYLDAAGKPVEDEMAAWNMLKTKGTTLYLIEREGPDVEAEPSVGEIVSVYEVSTDEPQPPSSRTEGYVKRIVPLAVLDARTNVTIAAGA